MENQRRMVGWADIASSINESLTMDDVLREYAPSTPRRGHRCPCPIHNGKDNNFSYTDHRFKCFVCGAGGDVIAFVKEVCGLPSMSDAMKRINTDFHLGLPIGGQKADDEYMAQMEKRRAEKREEDEKKAAVEAESDRLWDEWVRLDKTRMNADPESDEYANAVKRIGIVEYMLDTLPSKAIDVPKSEPVECVQFREENLDKNGNPRIVIENFVEIMRHDSKYAGIRYNELSGRAEVHSMKNGKLSIVPWSDADEAKSMNYIENAYRLYSKDKHSAALRILFDERSYNPIIDIVDNIVWDGKSRCENFLHEWAKVEDSDYTREVSRLIFAGGIHRLYQPGTKFDDVPILIGTRQGEGKSSLIRFLAIHDQYYGEVNLMEGQQAIEQIRGKWICEISELLALTKAKEQEAAKAYITRQVDTYRKPWDKNPSDLPRRCIMIGTTNSDAPLTDKTGNRRYYPVEVHCNGYDLFDHEQECRDYILQCWAEARELYRKGKMPNYADRKLTEAYREAQSNATQDDWRVGAIAAFLERKLPGELTCVREVCHRALSPNPDFPKEPSLIESKDIGAIITRLPDWEKCGQKRIANYGSQRCWIKVEVS